MRTKKRVLRDRKEWRKECEGGGETTVRGCRMWCTLDRLDGYSERGVKGRSSGVEEVKRKLLFFGETLSLSVPPFPFFVVNHSRRPPRGFAKTNVERTGRAGPGGEGNRRKMRGQGDKFCAHKYIYMRVFNLWKFGCLIGIQGSSESLCSSPMQRHTRLNGDKKKKTTSLESAL